MKLLIMGAGGFGRTVADVASQSGLYSEIKFLDDYIHGPHILGKCSDFKSFNDDDTFFYPAFGDNFYRIEWINALKSDNIRIPIIAHSTAYVSPHSKIEEGSIVLPKVVINTGCTIKKGCIINCGAIIDHDCIIEEGVHVCLGAIVKGQNRIAACTKIEAGQVVQLGQFPL